MLLFLTEKNFFIEETGINPVLSYTEENCGILCYCFSLRKTFFIEETGINPVLSYTEENCRIL